MQTLTQAWKDHRPYLVDLAFRMLGDIGAAEDVVQDAFSRLARADLAGIEDARGWLIVVTSRLCLDQIRSARMRREQAHDSMDIEFVSPGSGRPADDPADRVTLDDNVRLALLVVLQRLSPAERVVFVLHDIFQLPFDAVARTLGKPAPTCRQLARRARQKIGDGHGGPRFSVDAAEHRQVTERFIAACTNGDLGGLLAVLDPSAWGTVDLGPDSPRTAQVITGAHRVARNLIRYWGQGATLVSHPIAGQPAVLGFTGRRLAGVLVFTMRGRLIQSVQVIADPRQLGFLNAQLASLG
jgi:RNA polymerase sigma-70 factor (ECF subfamily)